MDFQPYQPTHKLQLVFININVDTTFLNGIYLRAEIFLEKKTTNEYWDPSTSNFIK